MSKAETGGISTAGTVGAFFRKGACSETLLHVINLAFDHPMTEEEHASSPLAGGILLHGYQCGMLWGATLAAGAQAYHAHGAGPRAESRSPRGGLPAVRAIGTAAAAIGGRRETLRPTGIPGRFAIAREPFQIAARSRASVDLP